MCCGWVAIAMSQAAAMPGWFGSSIRCQVVPLSVLL